MNLNDYALDPSQRNLGAVVPALYCDVRDVCGGNANDSSAVQMD